LSKFTLPKIRTKHIIILPTQPPKKRKRERKKGVIEFAIAWIDWLQRSKAQSTIHRKPTQFEEREDINKSTPQQKKKKKKKQQVCCRICNLITDGLMDWWWIACREAKPSQPELSPKQKPQIQLKREAVEEHNEWA
jgi:hypothetical protein